MEARGQFLPVVGYSGNAYRGRNALLGTPNPGHRRPTGETFDAFLSAAWEPDLWGRLRRLDEAARAHYLASEEARRGAC